MLLVGQCGVGLDRQRKRRRSVSTGSPRRRAAAASAPHPRSTLVVRYAFGSLGLERVELKIDPANFASQGRGGVRPGFTYEGTLRSDQPFKGHRMDSQILVPPSW